MAQDFILPTATNHLRQRRENSPLLPFREPTGNPMLYKAIAQNSATLSAYQQSLQMLNDRVSRCERRGAIQDDISADQVAIPFAIYLSPPASNAASVVTSGGTYTINQVVPVSGGTVSPGGSAASITVLQVDASGNLLTATWNPGSYTTPPPYPASLASGSATVAPLSSGDAYRVYGIRSGYVGARSQKNALDNTAYPINGLAITSQSGPWGNGEWLLECILDNEQPFSYGATPTAIAGTVTLPNSGPILISGYLPDGTLVKSGQIALPSTATEGQASFWIQIVDTPGTGFYANVYGQLGLAFPEGDNILPIGAVSYTPSGTSFYASIYQMQCGNAVNRWAAMNVSEGGYQRVFRGFNSVVNGQYFYTGDEMVDDTRSAGTLIINAGIFTGVTTVNLYVKWLWNGPPSTWTDSPGPIYGTGQWLPLELAYYI